MRFKGIVSVVTAAFFLFSVPAGTFAVDQAPDKQQVVKPAYQLLFFMNPNGRPCQMQDEIIKEIADSLAKFASVKYYKTTEPADRAVFGSYGIRGLPSLIIVDGKGKEIKRFTPGVQEGKTILGALQPKK